jgi:hypothetical protein
VLIIRRSRPSLSCHPAGGNPGCFSLTGIAPRALVQTALKVPESIEEFQEWRSSHRWGDREEAKGARLDLGQGAGGIPGMGGGLCAQKQLDHGLGVRHPWARAPSRACT